MSLKLKKSTAYGVFIVESLRPGDEHDAKIMSKILEMSNIVAVYNYATTVEDFEKLLVEFKESNFRYLHISSHADKSGLEVNGKDFSNQKLLNLLKGGMQNKRLFISACQGANRNLAKKIIGEAGAMSLIGTPVDLYFDKAVLFWPSFYHIMNEIDGDFMKRKMLIETLQKCTDLFNVPVNYYSKVKNAKATIRRLKIRKGLPALDDHLTFKEESPIA